MTEITHGRHAARLGDAVVISLRSNPSTGYRWEIDRAASKGLDRVDIEETERAAAPSRAGPPLVGAPGEQTWRVRPRRTGQVELVLIHRRVWESVPPIGRHMARIDIGD